MDTLQEPVVIQELRRKVLKKISGSSFARGLGLLLGGSIIAQVIALAFSPIITRLYTPNDFGAMGVYVSILAILTVGAMLRYEAAIPGADTDEEAVSLLVLCVIVVLANSLLVAAVLFLAPNLAIRVGGFRAIWPYRYLLALGMFSTGCYLGLSFWSIRVRDYRLLSTTKITQSIGLVATQVVLGIPHLKALGLILSQIVGQSAGSDRILKHLIRTAPNELRGLSYHSLRNVAVRYRRFPKLSMPATLMEAGSNNLPLLFMAGIYSTTVAGWITLVQRVIFLPMAILARNVTQVYFGELAAMKRSSPGSMKQVYISRLKRFSGLSFAGALPIAVLAPLLIPFIFGAAWRNSVICLEILIPAMVLAFIATPFGCTLDVLERQDLHLLRDTIRLLVTLTALGLTYWLKIEWQGALMLISLAGCLGSVFYLWISWVGIRDYEGLGNL